MTVSLLRMPSLSSLWPISKPGAPRSTMKALTPLPPRSGSVLAMTTKTCAHVPLVMNCLCPVMRQPAPSFTARVCIDAASEPPHGSVSPQTPIHSPRASFGR